MGPTDPAFWKNLQTTTGDVFSLGAQPLVYSPSTGKYVTASDRGAAQASISFSFGKCSKCGKYGKCGKCGGLIRRRSRRSQFGKRYNIAYFTKGHKVHTAEAPVAKAEFGAFPKWNPPKSVEKRRSMLKKCGKKCFLKPDMKHPGFPVCNNNCKVMRKGLLSAFIRARQWGYQDIAKMAERKLKQFSRKGSRRSSRRTRRTSKRRHSRRSNKVRAQKKFSRRTSRR